MTDSETILPYPPSQVVPRTPHPIPFGWFGVAYPEEVEAGKAKALYYLGQHLVAWRDESGEAHVADAFCPHLGAHLGHGGTVCDGKLVCPFHGWEFNAEGENTCIPYSDRTNRKARLRTYPTREVNGRIVVWYHPDEVDPLWEPLVVPEISDGEWSGPKRTRHVVATHIQEMAENQVDSAHFRYVHNVDEVPVVESYETEGHVSRMRSSQKFPTPRGVVDGRIDNDADGPGLGVVRFSGIVDTMLLTFSTPVDANHTEVCFNFYVRNLGDESVNSSVGEAFASEVDRQFQEDTPIWEHKAHLVRPALADTDGPFMKFRKWYAGFYAESASSGDERLVFPPPYWPEKVDESPAKATASARHQTK